jgi:Bacterial Ig domain
MADRRAAVIDTKMVDGEKVDPARTSEIAWPMPPWAADTEMVDGEKLDPAAAEVEKGETAHAGSDDDGTVEMPPVAAVVPLSAVLVSGPSHGSLTLNADGSLTYSPDDNFNGGDSFTYRASDGSLAPDSATLTLTVTARHHPQTVTVAVGGRCGGDHNSGSVNPTVPDVESPAADLTLSAASSDPGLVSPSNVVDGRSGTAILTVTVTDGQACDSVLVTVKVGGTGEDTLTGGKGADQHLALEVT